MKKRLSVLLLAVLLSALPALPSAAAEIVSKKYDQVLEMQYNRSISLTATGSNATPLNATPSNGNQQLPEMVFEVSVGQYDMTFMVLDEDEKTVQVGDNHTNAISWFYAGNLFIPDSVVYNGELYSVIRIGDDAFYNLTLLTGELNIPSSVTSIGDSAFAYCEFTGNLTIPSGVTSIGSSAFNSCKGFTGDLIIPDSVTELGSGAFSMCSNLDGILKLPSNITCIKNYTFINCSSLTGNLMIPSGVTSIESWAFSGCGGFTGNLTLPAGLKNIGLYAFEDCDGFTGSLILPPSLYGIGSYAFKGCNGISGTLIIPSGLEYVTDNALCGMGGLTEICVANDNPNFSSEDGILYDKTKTSLIQCPMNKQGNLKISSKVIYIDESAFMNCKGLTGNLTIPEGVMHIGGFAFSGCSGLTGGLVLPSSVRFIGEKAFYDCSGLSGGIVIQANELVIREGAFMSCSGLDYVKFFGNSTFLYKVFDNCKEGFILYYPMRNTTWENYEYVGDSPVNIKAYDDSANGNNTGEGSGGSGGGGGTSVATSTNRIGNWIQDEHGWWYKYSDNSWPKDGWALLEYNHKNEWYYFNKDGYMVTGWVSWNNKWYYMNPILDGTQGRRETGWVLIDERWYYFNEKSDEAQGTLVQDARVGEYYLNKDGVWEEEK